MTNPSHSRRLQGQVALITGATGGIGKALAKALASEGCNLILVSRNESALKKISKELSKRKIQILAHPCDVRDPRSVDDLFRAARREFRKVNILINNAGIAHASLTIDKLPYPVWKDVLATNLDGTFLVTQAALAVMKRGGTIVNNLSIAATRVFAPPTTPPSTRLSVSRTTCARNFAPAESASSGFSPAPPTPISGTRCGHTPLASK